MGLAHGWRARPWVAIAGACAAGAALPSAAAAAPTWLPATDLSGTQTVYCQPASEPPDPPMPAFCFPSQSSPDIGLSPDGRALALWSPWSGWAPFYPCYYPETC